MTDEFGIYNTLKWEGYKHQRVKHKDWEFARGNVHTNSVEGFWSHVKAPLRGTYRSVSNHHLQKYLDERVYHWNHRFEEPWDCLMGR